MEGLFGEINRIRQLKKYVLFNPDLVLVPLQYAVFCELHKKHH